MVTDIFYDLVVSADNGTIKGYLNGVLASTETPSADLIISRLFGSNSLSDMYSDAEIVDLQFGNRALSLQEIKEYHNDFVMTPIEVTHEYDPVGSFPEDFIKGTGTFVVKEMTTADAVLSGLKIGTKYLECTSAGTCAIQNPWAYGGGSFYVYKESDTTQPEIKFISSDKEASTYYSFKIDNNDKWIALTKDGSRLFYTADNYVENNKWYKIDPERTEAGKFTWYISGGAFGSIPVLIDPTGGSGTNPVTDNTYTENKYSVLALGVGDRVILGTVDNGIKQF